MHSPRIAWGTLVVVASVILILAWTTGTGDSISSTSFNPCILCGSVGTTNFLLNIVLFAPLAFGLRLSGWPLYAVVSACIALSCAIEIAQLSVLTGRDSTLGDVIANTAGAFLGFFSIEALPLLLRPARTESLVLAGSLATLMILLASLTSWLFHASVLESAFYGQTPSTLGPALAIRGEVSQPLLNGELLPGNRLASGQEIATKAALLENKISLQADVWLMQTRRRPSTIIRVATEKREEVARLGAAGIDAFFSVRTRAADLRLRQPIIWLRGAFRCEHCADGVAHATTTVIGQRSGNVYDLSVPRPNDTLRTRESVSSNMTWVALTQGIQSVGPVGRATTFFWVVLQFSLFAFWLCSATRSNREMFLVAGAICLLGAVTQGLVPALTGTANDVVSDWLSVACGTLLGYLAWRTIGVPVRPPTRPNL